MAAHLITIKRSNIHNRGVFAACDIRKGQKIIEYVGERISKTESARRGDIVLEESRRSRTKGAVYIFNLNRRYDLDGNVSSNPARYINHSCEPNCEAVQDDDDRIWIIALRDIKKDEELSYNYGYDFADIEDHPCQCGTPSCVGYILDTKYWPHLARSRRVGTHASSVCILFT